MFLHLDNHVFFAIRFSSIAAVKAGDQLVSQESSSEGSVSWRVYHQYCQAAGGLIQQINSNVLRFTITAG